MPDLLLDLAGRVRALKLVPQRAATRVADAVRIYLRGTTSAGTDANGRQWAPRKDGSGAVLKGATAALSVRAIGPVVVCRVTGRHALHDLGVAQGAPRRGILPDAELAPELERRIAAAIDQEVTNVLSR